MDEETEYIMPPGYTVVAEALTGPINRLRSALSARVPLDGDPFFLDSLPEVEVITNATLEFIDGLEVAVDRLSEEMNSPLTVSEEDGRRAVAVLDVILADYLDRIYAFLRRPWPDGTEAGRVLFAALLERPLRDMLAWMEKIQLFVRDPARGVEACGGPSVKLMLVLDVEAEAQAFHEWIHGVKQKIWTETAMTPRRQSDGLFGLLAWFIFGYWIGKD